MSSSNSEERLKNLIEAFGHQQQLRSVLETEIKQLSVYNEQKDRSIQELNLRISNLQNENYFSRANEAALLETLKSLRTDLEREKAQKSAMQLTLTDLESKAQKIQQDIDCESQKYLERLEIMSSGYVANRTSLLQTIFSPP